MAVKDWSTSAASNTSVAGINIAPGMLRSDVDNALRALMADLKTKFNEMISVKDQGAIGDNIADDAAAIQAALNSSTSVYLPAGVYRISTPLNVPSGVTFWGTGTIAARTGYSASYLMTVASNASVVGISFDGTNMPIPTAAWMGGGTGTARAPVGSAIFVNGASGSEVTNVTLDGLKFANFPSGPVCGFYADFIAIRNCKSVTVQTYTANETNGVFHIHQAVQPKMSDCLINGFNWKGYYLAYATNGTISACGAKGGSSGQAAHYVTYGTGTSVLGCSHSGGFGFKCTNAEDVLVDGYLSLNSSNAGLYAYCSKNVVFANSTVKQPATKGVLITADSSFGPCQNITVSNVDVIYKTAAAGINEVGIFVSGDATYGVENVTITGCNLWQAFFGVQIAGITSAVHSKITIAGNNFYRPVQYGILGYVKSAVIANNTFDLNTAFPAGYLLSQASVAGDDLAIIANRSFTSSGSGVHWDIATGAGAGSCVFSSILFANNLANGGNEFIKIAGNNATTDAVNNVTLTGNVGNNLAAADAILFTANATTTTNATTITGNVLSTGALRKNVKVVNSVKVTNKVDSGNNVNAVTYA